MSPARRRLCIDRVIAKFGVSERLACRVLGQHRSTQRKVATSRDDEASLTADIIELATQYGRMAIGGLQAYCARLAGL